MIGIRVHNETSVNQQRSTKFTVIALDAFDLDISVSEIIFFFKNGGLDVYLVSRIQHKF